MTTYSLALDGSTKRIWKAEAKGKQVAITAGTAAKSTVKTSSLSERDVFKAALAKLRAGYALAEPDGALVGLLGLATSYASVDITPDGTQVWQAWHGIAPRTTLRIYALATGKKLAEHELGIERVRDLYVCSATRALGATEGRGVVELGADGRVRTWSRALKSVTSIAGAGDHVLITGQKNAVLLDARTAKEIARIKDVEVAALSEDGALVAVVADDGTDVRVIEAATGRERKKLSLKGGRGVRGLAISARHVVAAGICFEGARRSATWCWSLPSGKRAMTERFDDENDDNHKTAVLGPGGLLATLHNFGHLDVRDGSEVRLDTSLLGQVSKGEELRRQGRWLLGSDYGGVVAVWDFERLRAGKGSALPVEEVEEPPPTVPKATPVPRTQVVAKRARAGIESLALSIGRDAHFEQWVSGGAVYYSLKDEHSTFVDLTSWPPSMERRAQVVIRCARDAEGQWLTLDRDGLWRTDDFAVQGAALVPPFKPYNLGWLGDAPIVFDEDGAVAPQVHTARGWKPIAGLAKADASGDTSVIALADGTSLITFRGAAYRVSAALRAKRVLEQRDGWSREAVPLADGRFATRVLDAVALRSVDGARVDVSNGRRPSSKYMPWRIGPGPRGALLITYSDYGRGNETEIAGAWIDLAEAEAVMKLTGGKIPRAQPGMSKGDMRGGHGVTLIEKKWFGATAKQDVADLLACEDRIIARVGDTFRAIRWPRR